MTRLIGQSIRFRPPAPHLDSRSREPISPRTLWNTRGFGCGRFRFADGQLDRSGPIATGKSCHRVVMTELPNTSRHWGPIIDARKATPSPLCGPSSGPRSPGNNAVSGISDSERSPSCAGRSESWLPPLSGTRCKKPSPVRLRASEIDYDRFRIAYGGAWTHLTGSTVGVGPCAREALTINRKFLRRGRAIRRTGPERSLVSDPDVFLHTMPAS